MRTTAGETFDTISAVPRGDSGLAATTAVKKQATTILMNTTSESAYIGTFG
jgi:hypothetical protein